jgi:hypothetical protein
MLTTWAAEPHDAPFASDPAADRLVRSDLSAFLMAAALDRVGQSFKLWEIPYLLRGKWGHLDTQRIQAMDPAELAADPIIAHAPAQTKRLHLAKSIISVAKTIELNNGEPERLFDGDMQSILERLDRIFGIGLPIAHMIVIQRILYFGFTPPGGDLLPKTDVHVMRVLARTGVVSTITASDQQVRSALVGFSPFEIAILDQVAWRVGRELCHAKKQPNCPACPLHHACEYYSNVMKGRT